MGGVNQEVENKIIINQILTKIGSSVYFGTTDSVAMKIIVILCMKKSPLVISKKTARKTIVHIIISIRHKILF